MSSRWTGFFIWALVAASSAFWGFKIFAATRPVPPGAQAPLAAIPPSGPMERLFGAIVVPTVAVEAPHPDSERFQLVGVIAPNAGGNGGGKGDGLAIVAIDGQPAKPWRLGATLDGNTTLLAVAKRTADFGPPGGPSTFTLQLPEPAAAVTGTLPTAQPQPDNMTPPPVAPVVSRGNADHVAQPGFPPQRNLMSRGFQRATIGQPGAVPPARVVQPSGQGVPAEDQPQKSDTE